VTSQNPTAWKTRSYQTADKESCLKIFESNTPQYFLVHERENFSKYLDENSDGYSVIEDSDGKPIACGGYAIGLDGGVATLCWGMVDKAWHGHGLGRLLLTQRLSTLARFLQMKLIRMDTSQHSVGFFMKWGFKTYRITRNYYGPDLHRHEMYLILDDGKARGILSYSG
jgi:ribosomal protein S18 acetylase RimI-like enzyme